MKTPQEWMESKGAGKQHATLMTRIDIMKIQEDAQEALRTQIAAQNEEMRCLYYDVRDMRTRMIEDHR